MWSPHAGASSPRSGSSRTQARSCCGVKPEAASLSRVMREPAFTAAPRLVAFGHDLGLPEAVQTLIPPAAGSPFAGGRGEGVEAGTSAAARQAAALAGPVAEAIEG